jgi:hypothetical protein
MKAEEWLKALYAEDIFSFPHLSNLKQNEWDNIRRLSMNAKRILKTAIDRERESVADDRRRFFEEICSTSEELPRPAGIQIDTILKYVTIPFLENLPFDQTLYLSHTPFRARASALRRFTQTRGSVHRCVVR